MMLEGGGHKSSNQQYAQGKEQGATNGIEHVSED